MRTYAAVVVLSEVAVEAKNLQFVCGREIVPDEPHIEASLANLLAVLSAIVVNVVDSEEANPVFPTASAFPTEMADDRFLEQSPAFLVVLSEIGPNTSGVLVSVSLCSLQDTVAVLFIVVAICKSHAVFASWLIYAALRLEIELGNGLFDFALGASLGLGCVGLDADCHAHEYSIYGFRFPAVHTVMNVIIANYGRTNYAMVSLSASRAIFFDQSLTARGWPTG